MIYEPSTIAVAIFLGFVGLTLGLSFYLGRQAKSSAGYFAGPRPNPLVCQRNCVRWRLLVRSLVSGHLRNDRVSRLRRLPLLDWLSRRLDCRVVCRRRADETDGKIYLRRRVERDLQFSRHSIRCRHQHVDCECLLSDPADGRRRRSDSAFAGFPTLGGRAVGRCDSDRDCGIGGDGLDNLGPVFSKDRCWLCLAPC